MSEPFNFPRPGYRQQPAALVLEQRDVAALLAGLAGYMAVQVCPAGATRDNCNATRALWWRVCGWLDRPLAIELQAHLRAMGVPLPDGPWEDIDPVSGDPLPRQ